MQSRLTKILLTIGVIVSFLPVVAIDLWFDNFLHRQVSKTYHASAKLVSDQHQLAVFNSINSLSEILKTSPSLCTSTFISNVKKQLQLNQSLIQVLVENTDGVQYCDGFGEKVKYSVLSQTLPIPGKDELISVVQLDGHKFPSFKITHKVGANRLISAFVYINANLATILPQYLIEYGYLKMKLTNGEQIYASGKIYDEEYIANSSNFTIINSTSNILPISVELVLPFDVVRNSFSWVYITLTAVFALLGGVVLLVVLNYLRQTSLPAIDLERAVALGEFKPYYQPVVNIKTGQLVGCEVLMRWVKRNGEVIAPGMFIDYAESSGLAFPMTIALMEQVATDLGSLCLEQKDLKIGINLFEGHFRDTHIVEDVKTIFGNSDISFRQLVFEITERRPLKNQLAVDGVIGGLQALGCRIAMDDAGTGHSNLAYMQTLNVDIIKIDRVFVNMIREGVDNVPILDGLISIAQDLGAGIIAEGIETQEQVNYLREHGVYDAQGFLFSPAIRSKDFVELARRLNTPFVLDENITPISKKVA